MEKRALQKQFDYKENSNLVLTTEHRTRDHLPTSDVQSLAGRLSANDMMKMMGSRAGHTKPEESSKDKKKRGPVRSPSDERALKQQRRGTSAMAHLGPNSASVLNVEVENIYRPQTRETKLVYETLLTFLLHELGDKSHDILASCADEVLSILKEDKNVKEQESDLAALFGHPLDSERMRQLVTLGKKITDFHAGSAPLEGDAHQQQSKEEEMDEKIGVSVVFDEEDQEMNEEVKNEDLIKDDDDSDVDVDVVVPHDGVDGGEYSIGSHMTSNPMLDDDDEDQLDINPRQIDAHWLQREIATFQHDAVSAQKLAEQVLSTIQSSDSDGAVENKLVQLLEFERFSLIKKLLRNRQKIVYCIRLARSSDADREAIESEMMSDPKLAPILSALKKTSNTAADRNLDLEKTLMKEARNLGLTRKGGLSDGGVDASFQSSTDSAFWQKPKAIVDLDALVFAQGGHTMTSGECKLPKNSEIINKKGYQEVHIPPLKPKARGENEKEVLIADMPAWAQPAFARMTSLNRVQSRVYETAMKSPENMLICAPTGAGKTNVAMLTMLREIGLHQRADGTFNTDAFKIIYVAPMKSLVQEMVLNFGARLKPYGINVAELSGDAQLTKEQLSQTQVIVTTPEKWDVVTRKSGDRAYTQLVKLIIIDEIHLLHDSRGPVLESIVSRTIRQIEQTQDLIRLVGLSATLPNYEDVALFLRVKADKGLFFFDNSFRPVPLQQQYIGITHKKAFKRHQLMNEICYEKVAAQAGHNQILVFVHSRKETATTARALKDAAMEKDELDKFIKDDARRLLLKAESENCKNQALKELLPYGFGIHHAGLHRSDRKLVEELFDGGHIQVLCSTATLAWGVNLPAHTVIIKGTQVYSPELGNWTEISQMDVQQMLGRAGRPQYDTAGEGIIITSHRELHYYLSLLNEQLPIESQFMAQLADNLNAEVVLGSVTNLKEAVEWLGYTYLYVRMLRRPQLYGISHDQVAADPYLEQRRLDLAHSAATILDKHALIKYDKKTGNMLSTDLGRVASDYYLTHHSVSVFNDYLKPTLSDIELFRVFSLSSEFKNVTVRDEERIELAKLLDKVPIPVKEAISEPSAKVNVLLQAYISRLNLEGFALMADMVYITQSAGRIVRALFEIVLRRGWSAAALKCINLAKMIDHRCWSAQSPLRQFSNIPQEIIKRIESKDIPFDRFYDLEAPAIGELIRFPKMGNIIYKAVHQIPKFELEGHVQPITRSTLRVELTITPDFQYDEKVHGAAQPFWIFVEDVDGEIILHYEYFLLKKKFSSQEHSISFTIPIFDPLPPQYFVRVLSDRWLGSEVILPMSFRHLLLPEKFVPPTELLDLQPLSINEIANETFIHLYENQFKYFNPIQTQVFNCVYKKNDNLLVAAPTGSGKTVIAELAIIRQLIQDPSSRIVYIAPLESLAIERFQDWRVKFKRFGVRVVSLTGEAGADLKFLTESNLIIATPDQWDILSRRWKTRKPVQDVKLFICDELQLIGGQVGPVLEVIVSRMRFMATQLKSSLRIVGLSASIANAKDLGEWIGASSQNIFNFDPKVRPTPIEIQVKGFDHNDFSNRQIAMIKPAYTSITTLTTPDKPTIVFVPSKKFAKQVAVEFMTMASGEDKPNRFLGAGLTRADMRDKLKKCQNQSLCEVLCAGIAFYHEAMPSEELELVQSLFKSGLISVVVSEYSLTWGMTMSSYMTVIMGAQQYDGAQHRYVDIPLTDIIQMIGRANRPMQDQKSVAVIFCVSAKKEFYKKFLYQPFPVESHLDQALADHLNAEIITKRVETVQDAVDYLTWSFLYRRLTQNPNYYHLSGVSHRHFSDHLSELIENTLEDLQQAKCISIEDETDLSPTNLGFIAAYYNLKYTSVEIFSRSLQKKTKLKGLLEILSSASEFDDIPVRPKEEMALRKLSRHLPLTVTDSDNFEDAHVKTNILLQSHFSRVPLSSVIHVDLKHILPISTRLLQAMVDVLSSSGWLSPALACMEMSQMITQGMWNNQSVLLQLPFFTQELADKCKEAGVNTIPDLMELEDDDRNNLLQFTHAQLAQVANVCNSYPDIDVSYEMRGTVSSAQTHADEKCVLEVVLLRDPEDDESELSAVPIVLSQHYPVPKAEGWWLVLGNTETNEVVSIKRVAMSAKQTKVNLEFIPTKQGQFKYKLYFMSDSYLGVDQEYAVELEVLEGREEESDEEEEEEEA